MNNTNISFNPLPTTGYVRIRQIVGDPKANPPIPPIIPVGRSTWWRGVSEGRFPKPVKLGPRTSAWRVEDLRDLLDSFEAQNDDGQEG